MATTGADILVRAVMQGSTGLPADTYVNDFAFHHDSGVAPTDLELLDLFGAVDAFYNFVTTTTNSVAKYIGEAVSRAVTHEMEFFNIFTMGSPRLIEPWLGPGAPGTTGVNEPTEVSGVLSFHADLTGVQEEVVSTRPRARRRGRVYVGPLTRDAILFTAAQPVLQSGFTQTLREAALEMADVASTAGFTWSVWSRADDILRPVVAGWTDNAPDTQRRRGSASTSRVTFGPI